MATFYAVLLAMGAILRLKVTPTLRVIINILYLLPSFFYLVLLFPFVAEVPLSSLRVEGAVDKELTCIFRLSQETCGMALKLGNIVVDRGSPIILVVLW
jgi:hypothetical protein